jgi:hypothetical protein
MIIGGRITSVEGKKTSENVISGLNINMTIDDVKASGSKVEIDYTYTVTYATNVGTMTIRGTLVAEEEKSLVKEINDSWQKSKKLPDDYAELTLNSVNYTGTANGTLIARVLNLSPPLVPPKIQITREKK